ncbi:MAG: hypothetical protein IIC88_00860 [Chloroflexi bacterium]|nr:hypothetical protein [Chloroflexota bacterium]
MKLCVFLLATVAAVAVACGGGSSDEREIGKMMETFFSALGDDPAEAYDLLAQKCRQTVSYSDFTDTTVALGTFLGVNQIKIRNVEIVGRKGNMVLADLDIVLLLPGEELPFSGDALGQGWFVKENDGWRLADCENFLPPEANGGAEGSTAVLYAARYQRLRGDDR